MLHRSIAVLAGAAAFLCAPELALAQAPAGTVYMEFAVAVPPAAWTLVMPADASALRRQLIISDAIGAGCAWSLNAAPATGVGVPFSTTTNAGSYLFDPPVPLNAVYVRCAAATTITVELN